MFSFISPVSLGFITIIISPLSYTCSPHRAVALYTSCLLEYSSAVMEMLHLIFPLFLLIPLYNSLLLAFEGHSSTNLNSPGGDFTLTQPVAKAKSCPRCASRAVFHCSLSPLYRLDYICLVDSLCTYSQQDLSTSKLTFLARILDDYHFSIVGSVYFGG